MTKTATVHAQQRWEYMTIARKTDTYLARELNPLGQDGWELVSASYDKGPTGEMFWTAFLKRPAVSHPAPGTAQESAAAHQDSAVVAPSPATPSPVAPSPAAPSQTQALQGFDVEGDMFTIHEEPDDKKPDDKE